MVRAYRSISGVWLEGTDSRLLFGTTLSRGWYTAAHSKSFFMPSTDDELGRLSSDWESTRLKIELSPVQIREAAYSETATTNGASGPSKKRRRPRFEPGESQARNGERSEPQARNVSTQFKSGRASGPFHAVPHAVVERSRTRR